MVLTVSFGLSPVIGLFCHRRRWSYLHRLERQRRGVRTTRLRRPQACTLVKAPLASTASRSNVRDDRETPLCGTGRRGFRSDLGRARTEIFFEKGLDSQSSEQPVGQISRVSISGLY